VAVKYNFLGLLSSVETLGVRGRRLHDTPTQRQTRTYAPDHFWRVDVADGQHNLLADFQEPSPFSLYEGEQKELHLILTNAGMRPIRDVWLVCAPNDELWVTDNLSEDTLDSAGQCIDAFVIPFFSFLFHITS
jgi:trafficking protein particle complex subunit 8